MNAFIVLETNTFGAGDDIATLHWRQHFSARGRLNFSYTHTAS